MEGNFRLSESKEWHTPFAWAKCQATSFFQQDTLEVSVRSISTTVLTFSTWLPSLVFLSAALRLLSVSACLVILQPFPPPLSVKTQFINLLWMCQTFNLEEIIVLFSPLQVIPSTDFATPWLVFRICTCKDLQLVSTSRFKQMWYLSSICTYRKETEQSKWLCYGIYVLWCLHYHS